MNFVFAGILWAPPKGPCGEMKFGKPVWSMEHFSSSLFLHGCDSLSISCSSQDLYFHMWI